MPPGRATNTPYSETGFGRATDSVEQAGLKSTPFAEAALTELTKDHPAGLYSPVNGFMMRAMEDSHGGPGNAQMYCEKHGFSTPEKHGLRQGGQGQTVRSDQLEGDPLPVHRAESLNRHAKIELKKMTPQYDNSAGDQTTLNSPGSDTGKAEKTFPGAEREKDSPFHMERLPGVSDDFARQAKEALSKIPPNERQALEKAGYKVVLCNSLDQAGQNVDGGEFFNKHYGEFNPPDKTVYLAEYRENKMGESGEVKVGMPVKNELAEHSLFHEFGHALNDYMEDSSNHNIPPQKFSESGAFETAYKDDIDALLKSGQYKQARKEFPYYFDHEADRNRDEILAELYTSLRGEGDDANFSDSKLKHYFPNSYKALQDRLNKLE